MKRFVGTCYRFDVWLEVWWVMTGYGKPIWFNGWVLLYSWEKGQVPCAFGRGVMKVGTAHLSHYLKQARRLLLPAGEQTWLGSGYCATGRLLFPLPISGDSEILFYPVSERRVTTVTFIHQERKEASIIAYCCISALGWQQLERNPHLCNTCREGRLALCQQSIGGAVTQLSLCSPSMQPAV